MLRRLVMVALVAALFLALPFSVSAEKTLLASAARTATVSTGNLCSDLAGKEGFYVFVDVTALAATPAVTPTLQVQDPASGKWVTAFTAAAAITNVTGTGTYTDLFTQTYDPPAIGTEDAQLTLAEKCRLTLTHGDTDSITYSVGLSEVTSTRP